MKFDNTILPTTFVINESEILVRLLQPDDSFTEMTEMLHLAYRQLADMGLKFVATYQDETVTRERSLTNGICLVAVSNKKIIGTLMVNFPEWTKGTAFYEQNHVSHFGQFAIIPEFQKCGIGSKLLGLAEQLAFTALGATEIALDTSENAYHLLDYYTKRGYRFIEYVQWDVTNYRSKILSKSREDFINSLL